MFRRVNDEAIVIMSAMTARHELAVLIKIARRTSTRDGRKLSQTALGELVGCSQGKIQKIEAARVKIEPGDVEKILAHLDVDEDTGKKMLSLAALNAVGEPWSGERALVPKYVRAYMELEQDATEILSWHEGRIPGPLQSTHFMLQQFQTAGRVDVAPHMRNREQRRELFHRPQLQRYHCILGEEAIRRAATGLGRDTARDQIDYLLVINDPEHPSNLADHRTCVSLLPADAAVPFLPTDFSVLRFDNPKNNFVYIEHVGGAHHLKSDDVVQQTLDAWEELHHASLDRDGTGKLLRELRTEFASR